MKDIAEDERQPDEDDQSPGHDASSFLRRRAEEALRLQSMRTSAKVGPHCI